MPTIPESTCLYIIGDIHGRVDLLTKLLKGIEQDAANHQADRYVLVTLGDYIDRGPNSCKVIQTLIDLPLKTFEVRHLRGNHEELFLHFLQNPKEGALWLNNGGASTLLSYGFKLEALPKTISDLHLARDKLLTCFPESHMTFLKALKYHYQLGDYYFAHAGVDPEKSLEEQTADSLLWIRKEFLESRKNFGKIVVHGHTIVEKPEIHSNRIALDTGAFHTGKLTALMLNGEKRHFLQANENSAMIDFI